MGPFAAKGEKKEERQVSASVVGLPRRVCRQLDEV